MFFTQANLFHLPHLRDYSKAPFVLVSVLLLGLLVMHRMRWLATLAMAGAFGAVVGLGYGFRSDLMIMMPFGLCVIALLMPGSIQSDWARRVSAVAVALVTFVVVAWPPLQGLRNGGCQFHYSLLGLTTPRIAEMGIDGSIYGFGDHFLDTFVDLKVGDYGNRMLALPVPNLCSPDYDTASGALFAGMVTTFPADIVVHAYGSVLTVLSAGVSPPSLDRYFTGIPLLPRLMQGLRRAASLIAMTGPLLTAVAVGFAWVASPRLGLALTVFVLFLAGYPAIEFEERHWFHLRLIPLWAALLIAGTQFERVPHSREVWRATRPVVATLVLMVVALMALRYVQQVSVRHLVDGYLAAATEPMVAVADGPSSRAIEWQPDRLWSPAGTPVSRSARADR